MALFQYFFLRGLSTRPVLPNEIWSLAPYEGSQAPNLYLRFTFLRKGKAFSYQLAFLRPGTSPRIMTASLKHKRHNANFL